MTVLSKFILNIIPQLTKIKKSLILSQKFINIRNEILLLFNDFSSKLKFRTKKTTIADAIIFKLLYSQKNSSQEKITGKLSLFKMNKINRSSFSDRDKKINIEFYEKLSKIIDKYKNNIGQIINTKQVVAIDGTHSLVRKKIANKEGYTLNSNKQSASPLISGVFNVTSFYPEQLDLINHKDERKAFLDNLDNEYYKNNIFVLDRGYYDIKLIWNLYERNLNFVCRLKYNSKLIDKTKTDDLKTLNINGKQINVRIITYSIITDNNGKIDYTNKKSLTELDIKNGYKENKYYMITNLCDQNEYTLEMIKQIYHLRWSIEEYFKYIKTYCQFDYLIENDVNSIKKTIYSVLIVSQLVHIIVNEYTTKGLIVNKSLLTEGIYDEFLIRLIYGNNFNENWINFFLSVYIKTYSFRPNRQSARVCISPCNKSYRKYKGNKQYSKFPINNENNITTVDKPKIKQNKPTNKPKTITEQFKIDKNNENIIKQIEQTKNKNNKRKCTQNNINPNNNKNTNTIKTNIDKKIDKQNINNIKK